MLKLKLKKFRMKPTQVLINGYVLIILIGAVLLCLPIAARSGEFTPFSQALLTSASATCVTGLVIFDTYLYWSVFGQLVILTLIQLGGIGFMTLMISFLTLTKKRIGMRSRLTLQESVGASAVGGIVRTTRFILLGAVGFESIGVIFLSFRFIPEYGVLKGIYFSIFHSVSAFCNAGFDLFGGKGRFSSMTVYQTDPLVNFTIMGLIIIGGLGFFVWEDLFRNKLHFRKYKLQTKLVLVTTGILIFVSAAIFLLVEWHNPELKEMSLPERIMSMLFLSVTPRTAGFNNLNLNLLNDTSVILLILLMLIGGSSGSTAGGIKTTTIAVLFLNVFAVLHKKKHIECFKRRLESNIMQRASSIVMLYTVLFITASLVISLVEQVTVKESLFTAASAIGTSGLALREPSLYSPLSLVILSLLMFFGRIGGLTILLALSDTQPPQQQMPEEKITIG